MEKSDTERERERERETSGEKRNGRVEWSYGVETHNRAESGPAVSLDLADFTMISICVYIKYSIISIVSIISIILFMGD